MSSGRRRTPDRLPPLPLPDLTGRRVVVTGASAGIGFATAKALAAAGAEVVLAVRNPDKGEDAVRRILDHQPTANVGVELLELGSLASIEAFALRASARPVDLLINNAGTSAGSPEERTEDGFDLQIGVNYLGPWALTAQLWPALKSGRDPRVVMLGSTMSSRGHITADFGQPGDTYRSYCDSKLATVVLAGELRRRCLHAGVGVTAVAAHPGWCQTAIFDANGPPPFVMAIGRAIGAIQSAADGSQPILLAATEPRPGAYYGPSRFGGNAGPAGPVLLPKPALEPGVGELLWDVSTRLTGVAFEP